MFFFNCYLICKDIGNATHLYPSFFLKDVREPIVITAHKIITSSPYGTEIFANRLKLNLSIYEYHLFKMNSLNFESLSAVQSESSLSDSSILPQLFQTLLTDSEMKLCYASEMKLCYAIVWLDLTSEIFETS